MPGTLFIVSTPIGNLEDVTHRALRVLREVSLIAAEDTRRTAKLLTHFDIRTPTISYHEHNERERLPALLERLALGERVALVSDAGTPGVSDPGYRLVKAAIEAGTRVEAVPGASAILTALVVSGLPTNAFTFAGFPPSKASARDRWLAALAGRPETLVIFEAPHRVRETLQAVLRILGDRPAAACRELTKLHEELVRAPVSALLRSLPGPRGEFTLVIGPPAEADAAPPAPPDDDALYAEFCRLTESDGLRRREALSRLAERHSLSSRDVYAAIERAKRAKIS
jgi:16S rRNA (cytidine1402-2'-O)-methyltransferase